MTLPIATWIVWAVLGHTPAAKTPAAGVEPSAPRWELAWRMDQRAETVPGTRQAESSGAVRIALTAPAIPARGALCRAPSNAAPEPVVFRVGAVASDVPGAASHLLLAVGMVLFGARRFVSLWPRPRG